MEKIAIIDGVRTPFTKMGTDFNDLGAEHLGRIAMRELIERTGIDPSIIDEVIVGNVGQPANAANIARVVALLAGVPKQVPAYTVHRNCASGMESVFNAAIRIHAGEANVVMTAGTESMSNIPFFLNKSLQNQLGALQKAKTMGQRLAIMAQFYPKFFDIKKSLNVGLMLGLTDPVCGLGMGQTAEVLAKEFGITREEQDAFALASHLNAVKSKAILREEIVPVIPGPKFAKAVEDDNGPRETQTMEALAKLKPVFDHKSGSVTAGNSSQITDGAAALLVMKESRAKELGLTPLGYVRAFAAAGVEPHRMGIGPAHAIPKVLKKCGMKLKDIQLWEINEAFAAQVLACLKALESDKFAKDFGYEGFTGTIDRAALNIHGGAIALGHPVGTTGARLILTLLKHMKRANLNTSLASLCIGGGQGAAVVLER